MTVSGRLDADKTARINRGCFFVCMVAVPYMFFSRATDLQVVLWCRGRVVVGFAGFGAGCVSPLLCCSRQGEEAEVLL